MQFGMSSAGLRFLWMVVVAVTGWLAVGIWQALPLDPDRREPGIGLAVGLTLVPLVVCGLALIAAFFFGRTEFRRWERWLSLGLGVLACSVGPIVSLIFTMRG